VTSLPFVHVSGSHRVVGQRIGAACREQIQRIIGWITNHPPPGLTWDDVRRQAEPYLATTRAGLPWVVEELAGAAEGASVEFIDLFALGCEELWSQEREPEIFPKASGLSGRSSTGCTDFACAPSITATGHLLLAHNNDLSPRAEENLVVVERHVHGEPAMLTIGPGGLYVSIGFNAAGLALTGNELSPNDNRVGVPRMLIVRQIVACRTLEGAIAAATRPDRASSYNNLISHANGGMVNVEGSATDYDLLWAVDGWTVHTNHYLSPRMRRYEARSDDLAGSISRYERAVALIRHRPGPVTVEMLQEFLADHAAVPTSVCVHGSEVKTVFGVVIDLYRQMMWLAKGNPCQGSYQEFRL
jgi:isopenicillin-N N-acyltransferase-like protein